MCIGLLVSEGGVESLPYMKLNAYFSSPSLMRRFFKKLLEQKMPSFAFPVRSVCPPWVLPRSSSQRDSISGRRMLTDGQVLCWWCFSFIFSRSTLWSAVGKKRQPSTFFSPYGLQASFLHMLSVASSAFLIEVSRRSFTECWQFLLGALQTESLLSTGLQT